jgi:hypothetical protein
MMAITLDQITPEKIRELSDERDEQKITALVRAEVISLADEFHVAKQFAEELQARCQIRAWKMRNHGMGKDELADIFNVPVKTITAWLKFHAAVVHEGDW